MEELKGLIFDIQGFSVHDGAGSRTLVFLSGCPLRCEWCANPEGFEYKQKLLYSIHKCQNSKTGCIRCMNACPHGAVSVREGKEPLQPLVKKASSIVFDRSICSACSSFECVNVCYHEAARVSGQWMTLTELFTVIERDRNFWNNGGVTFTGGEPLVQKDFLLAALKQCRKLQIHTAIESTACVNSDVFLEVMPYIDFAFIDIKHMDTTMHIHKTGVSNSRILENITLLKPSGWKGRLILRMPVISGFNDTKENINAIIAFMNKNGLFEINILPFHRMGHSKWEQLGLVYKYLDDSPTPEEKLLSIQDMFLNAKIACYIGGNVLY